MIGSLPISCVYPGHGNPFVNLDEVLKQTYLYHYLQKQAVLNALADQPQTPYEICQKLYCCKGLEIIQGIANAWGYLDLLEMEGKVIYEQRERLFYYQCK